MIWNDFAKFQISKSGHNFFIWPPNEKTKGTLFYETLKVELKKVPLVFHLEVKLKSFGHFVKIRILLKSFLIVMTK